MFLDAAVVVHVRDDDGQQQRRRDAAMQFQELGWALAEGVAYITLHRPKRRNAMTTVMLAELLYALEHCASESAVRVVVLQGAGTGFCAGDDLAGSAPTTASST